MIILHVRSKTPDPFQRRACPNDSGNSDRRNYCAPKSRGLAVKRNDSIFDAPESHREKHARKCPPNGPVPFLNPNYLDRNLGVRSRFADRIFFCPSWSMPHLSLAATTSVVPVFLIMRYISRTRDVAREDRVRLEKFGPGPRNSDSETHRGGMVRCN